MPTEHFDYVVIGSGSAGGVVAARLTEDPSVSVLLLEAGPEDDDDMIHLPAGFSALFKTKWDWGYQTTPQKQLGGRRADWPRMKALGGCSSMNAMIYIRGNRADYDEWRDAYGADGWGYDDVLPYFIKAEGNTRLGGPFHGTDGPLQVEDRRYTHELSHAFVESAVAAGLQAHRRLQRCRAGGRRASTRSPARRAAAGRWPTRYIHPNRNRPNFTVRTEAFVQRIEMDGNRATGSPISAAASARRSPPTPRSFCRPARSAARRSSCSPGIGPGSHLREMGIDVRVDSPGVGQNLQDHPVSAACSTPRTRPTSPSSSRMGNMLKAQKAGRGPLTLERRRGRRLLPVPRRPRRPRPAVPHGAELFYDNGLHEPVRRGLTIASTLVRVAEPRAHRLRSADPTWHPEIEPGYFDDGADLDAMIAGYRTADRGRQPGPARRATSTRPGSRPTSNPTDDDIVASIGRIGQTLYHPVSTCAMGTIEGSVVGPDLRVHGVENLRVADASVMPAVPRGNTNAPTIMVGEKAADLIKESTMTAILDRITGSASTKTFDSLNPANGDVVGTYPIHSAEEVDAAVAARSRRGRLVAGPRLRGARRAAPAVEGRHHPAHGPARRGGASRDRQAAR